MCVAPPFEPLGAHELAERWGVSRVRVFQLLEEDDDMPPGTKLKGSRVWNLEDIEAYEAKRPGRRKMPPDPPPE